MPAEHLRELMRYYAPELTQRDMASRSGIPEHRLRELFRARATERMPTADVVSQIAAAIGAPIDEVFNALCEDRGYVWDSPTRRQRLARMRIVWRELDDSQQTQVLDYARSLLRDPTDGATSPGEDDGNPHRK